MARGGMGLGDLVLLGGLAFVAFNPTGRAVVQRLLPDLTPEKIGNVGLPGGPTGSAPQQTPQFWIVSTMFGQEIPKVSNGDQISFVLQVAHRGPAGRYVVGVDLHTGALGCPIGLYDGSPAFQNVEGNGVLEVGDDEQQQVYQGAIGGVPYIGSGFGFADARFYVRDVDGHQLAERWQCAIFWTV